MNSNKRKNRRRIKSHKSLESGSNEELEPNIQGKKKAVLNIHQIKVLEKMSQKKKKQNLTKTVKPESAKDVLCKSPTINKNSSKPSPEVWSHKKSEYNTRSSKIKKKSPVGNVINSTIDSSTRVSPLTASSKIQHPLTPSQVKYSPKKSLEKYAIPKNDNLSQPHQDHNMPAVRGSLCSGKEKIQVTRNVSNSTADVADHNVVRKREISNTKELSFENKDNIHEEAENKSICLKRKRDNFDYNVSRLSKKIVNGAERRLRELRTSLAKENSLIEEIVVPLKKFKDDVKGNVNDTEEVMDTFFDTSVNTASSESEHCTEQCESLEVMDWESMQFDEIKTILSLEYNETENAATKANREGIVKIVVDTNVLIHNMSFLEDIVKGENGHVQVVVPWIVLEELDNLKSKSQTNIEARRAITLLHKFLTEKKIWGQSSILSKQHLFKCENADDLILNCCLQLMKDFEIILVTNDINLCNKAMVNNICVATYVQFMSEHWYKLNIQGPKYNCGDKNIEKIPLNQKYISYKKLEERIVKELSLILKSEMVKQYENLWLDIVFFKPPWNLFQLLKCFVKHWIAVFRDTFDKDILKNIEALIEIVKNESNWNDEKYTHIYCCFKNIFTNLQSTNYERIATLCLKYLEVYGSWENITQTDVSISKSKADESNLSIGQISCQNIKTAIKCIYESLGKYCCSLAHGLGVSHNLGIIVEESIPLDSLLSQANSVGNQLQLLISSTERVATYKEGTSEEISKLIENLVYIFTDTLKGIGRSDVAIELGDLTAAYDSEREIFKKSHLDLMILNNLILECSAKYASMQNT